MHTWEYAVFQVKCSDATSSTWISQLRVGGKVIEEKTGSSPDMTEDLARLGALGWELIAVEVDKALQPSQIDGIAGRVSAVVGRRFWLKRHNREDVSSKDPDYEVPAQHATSPTGAARHDAHIPGSEWVEVLGRTVDEALQELRARLDIGQNAGIEYHVIEEPRSGLLGRRDALLRGRRRGTRALDELAELARRSETPSDPDVVGVPAPYDQPTTRPNAAFVERPAQTHEPHPRSTRSRWSATNDALAAGEFRCRSCGLVLPSSQLANRALDTCRDCQFGTRNDDELDDPSDHLVQQVWYDEDH
jgi:hypothetical protein